MTQHSPQRLRHHEMTLSAKYHYAQVLADRIHANAWTNPSKRLDYGDTPSFQVRGAGMIPTPLIIEARTGGHAKAGVPAARILLGNETYYDNILELTPAQFEAWYAWLEPIFDKHGDPATPPALFHSDGLTWRRSRNTHEAEQDAALIIFQAATVTLKP